MTEPVPTGYLRNWKRNLFGIAISCACLGFIAWQIDLNEVRHSISHFRWPYLFWGLLLLMFGYTMRILRWFTMLRAAGANVSRVTCVAPFLGSIALNNILPMRMGDIVRAFVFPSAIGVSKTTAAGSLVMERLVDLMTLLACLVIGLVINPKTQLPDWMANTAISLAIIGGVLLALVFLFSGMLSRWCSGLTEGTWAVEHPNQKRLLTTCQDLLSSFDLMSRLSVLIGLFTLSMLVWAGEAGLFWALLQGFALKAGPEIAVVVMAIITLSTLVPSSPGYFGPFHLAAYATISMLGGTPAQAASFAVVSHLGVWLPTTLAGALAILLNPHLFSGLKSKAAMSQ